MVISFLVPWRGRKSNPFPSQHPTFEGFQQSLPLWHERHPHAARRTDSGFARYHDLSLFNNYVLFLVLLFLLVLSNVNNLQVCKGIYYMIYIYINRHNWYVCELCMHTQVHGISSIYLDTILRFLYSFYSKPSQTCVFS